LKHKQPGPSTPKIRGDINIQVTWLFSDRKHLLFYYAEEFSERKIAMKEGEQNGQLKNFDS
jgi:hypothetical protein